MYGCESWTVKKAECRRTDTFELWCWRRLLRVPWTARRSNQSILMEIRPECSLEGLMLKLKLHYSGHLMWRTDSLEKTLMLGKIEARRRRGRQKIWCSDGITDSMDISCTISRSWWWTGRPGMLQFMGLKRVGHDWVTELNWTELAQTHVHWGSNAIQPFHPLSPPSLTAFSFSQHQGLFQWISSLNQVDKILELQLQHQSFQWIFRTDFL